jgi:hypothetical protein
MDDNGSPKQMEWDVWKHEVQRILFEEFGWTLTWDELDLYGDYYWGDYSPRDAVMEDMSYG